MPMARARVLAVAVAGRCVFSSLLVLGLSWESTDVCPPHTDGFPTLPLLTLGVPGCRVPEMMASPRPAPAYGEERREPSRGPCLMRAAIDMQRTTASRWPKRWAAT